MIASDCVVQRAEAASDQRWAPLATHKARAAQPQKGASKRCARINTYNRIQFKYHPGAPRRVP